MKTIYLEYFIATAQFGSISKTAKFYHVSQPTVSNGLLALEKELGYSLFNRYPSGVSLTLLGEKALPYAEACIKNKQHLLSLATPNSTILRTAAFSLVGPSIMIDMVSLFNQTYPDATFQVHEMRPAEILPAISQNQYPLAIGGEPEDSFYPFMKKVQKLGLILEPLYIDPFVIFLSPSNPLSEQDSLSLSNILDEPFASYNDFFLHQTNPYCQFHNIFGFSDQESIKKMIADNNAISFFPKSLMYKDFYSENGLIVYRCLSDYYLNLVHYILYHPDISTQEQIAISCIKQAYENYL